MARPQHMPRHLLAYLWCAVLLLAVSLLAISGAGTVLSSVAGFAAYVGWILLMSKGGGGRSGGGGASGSW